MISDPVKGRQNSTARSPWRWAFLAGAPLALAAGGSGYSAFAIDHRQRLPPALPGETLAVDTPAGRVNVYFDGPEDGEPLVLTYSINAAASAYEVRPVYLQYRHKRRVYAIDLPGFGFSQQDSRIYIVRVMVDAKQAVVVRRVSTK